MDAAASKQPLQDSDARLRALADLAERLGAPGVGREATEIAARVAEGRFYVACVGQFKRGKSTLLNAFVGEAVLPTGVVPVTSAITVLRHGPRGARVTFQDGRTEDASVEDLGAYVTEAGNPENRKGVRAVEVFLPSSLLARGMCLVDTPGLGSSFSGNTAVTRDFVPHVDAALVVVGADPPVSGDEVALAEEVAAHARHLIVVLNKADRLTADEREAGSRFAAQVLSSRLHRPIGRVYQVSAQERVASGRATRDWADLVTALEELARGSGAEIVEAAEVRAVVRLARALLTEISERRDALLRPIADSERRLAALEQHVAAAERAMADLGVLLAAEQAKLARTFRERQEAFLAPAQDAARRAMAERIQALTVSKSRLWGAAFEAARDVSTELVERFRADLEPQAERLYGAAMERFVALANQFLEGIAAEPGMEALPRAIGAETGFRVPTQLFYASLMYRTSRTPIGWLVDALRSRDAVTRAAIRRAGAYLDVLVESNSSRIANDLIDRATASRSRLEKEIRSCLREVSDRARRALDEAQRRISEGQDAVEKELSRLAAIGSNVESLLAARPKGETS